MEASNADVVYEICLDFRERMDKKRKRELNRLKEQLAQQQQLVANQNLHQSSSRDARAQADTEGEGQCSHPATPYRAKHKVMVQGGSAAFVVCLNVYA